MTTHIFIDKENGETVTTTATKDRLKQLLAPSKVFVEKSHPKTPLVGRTANVNLTESQSVRKALGSLNRPLTTTKSRFPKGKKFLSKKANENTSRTEDNSMVPEECPEKENLFSYNPLDFESFDVPEEHRLSHMSLTGVPLITFDSAPDRFASSIPLPAKQPLISWDYDCLQSTKEFLATLDEIVIDLPPPL
ncbi:securin [Ahaetulla prasina]|uniref:securin n=1 Tax=Ahaetulla prasina TaxID=499056 RepID=UPI002649A0BD|nr:securin [Ahaetulla prasina]XP_058026328.1 securin [Ahaetulla prasina]XP_058026329.1 securin [Ahaetulla prasina]XP_058026330.1 securin [Ahaetulla prasina]XP_058026331.1 securin [Ahaetulla prasina]